MSQTIPSRRRLNSDWLFGDSPGLAISSDSGGGKTNTIEVILTALARAGVPWLYIDPSGNSSRRMELIVSDLPPRLRSKFLIIRPSDLSQVISINPLHVPRDGCTPVQWKARVTSKVAHVVRILLAAWGEKDLNSRPRLFTWLYRILKTLALWDLTIPDAKYFLDPRDPLYHSIIRAVQDPLARRAFEDLANRRTKDSDEQIESCRNRVLGFATESTAVEAILGRSDGHTLSLRNDVLLQGRSVIVSLELGGELRDEDQAIFANLILTDFLFEVMNLPAELRRLYVVCLDELPIVANGGSGPLLMRSLREIRQFLVRYIFAFQGKDSFDDPRFFNLVLSQMGTLIAMRHTGVDDATAIARHIALPSYSAKKVKLHLKQEMQYQRDHEIRTLTDESENWSLAEQEGQSHGIGSAEQTTEGHQRQHHQQPIPHDAPL